MSDEPLRSSLDYELLDFGAGRKLERFGSYQVDRPAPATSNVRPSHPELWSAADARFDPESSGAEKWTYLKPDLPSAWNVRYRQLGFELRWTPTGQVGLFPEQQTNWDWLCAQATPGMRVLNLFGYTGASTLAVASKVDEVVHVDAATSATNWARRNAELSGMQQKKIRWITDDAPTFVARELRRGSRYDGILIDPPSYGHGTQGRVWKFVDQIDALLDDCRRLMRPQASFLLFTMHTTGWTGDDLDHLLRRRFANGVIHSGQMTLACADGRRLPSGLFARWVNK